jgi:hypothetical protein
MVARRITYGPTWTYDLTAPVIGEWSAFCEKRLCGSAPWRARVNTRAS